jgi:hypothetical protein
MHVHVMVSGSNSCHVAVVRLLSRTLVTFALTHTHLHTHTHTDTYRGSNSCHVCPHHPKLHLANCNAGP